MAIDFTCPHCGHHTSVNEKFAGSTGPCTNCHETVTIPGASAAGASPGPAPRKSSGGKSVLFVVLAVLAVVGFLCCGGMTLLLAPAVIAARGAAQKTACSGHMKMISLGLMGYSDQNRTYPPAFTTDENGKPMHSWRVLILPYLEESALYEQYDFDEPWDGPNNSKLMDKCPEVFRCLADDGDPNASSYQVVVDEKTGWKANDGVRVQSITDGISQTIAVVEVRQPGQNWLDPTPLKIADIPLGKPHSGGMNVVYFDGSTHFLPANVDRETLRRLLQINDGEVITSDF
ncbi:DUF1559 family PulG-like putative transporter [Lignipirellula cremea]|uniref:DUF1559 domain-containing protein n=1 Tax=Lignipirellula cremea TaxID=2528010 RepID=A0A518DU27_9BACT|nr:DUF1559 domain-containing protein [Lignipirellula cremea]QDU95329.1 hypothetical protein Pla8534_31440 [Lignipirellula cremea]